MGGMRVKTNMFKGVYSAGNVYMGEILESANCA